MRGGQVTVLPLGCSAALVEAASRKQEAKASRKAAAGDDRCACVGAALICGGN